jgi:ribosomal protein L28
MVTFQQSHAKTRSPRVVVPNKEPIVFNLGGHRFTAVLKKLSLTGGLAAFSSPINNLTLAEFLLETISGPVKGMVEFLAPQKRTGPNVYPFRFIGLSDGDYKRLSVALRALHQKGFGESAI